MDSSSLILAILRSVYVYRLFVCILFSEDLTKKDINGNFCFQKKIIILICLAVIIVILGSMVAGWLGIKR